MTTIDDLWFLADEATRTAERARHRLRERYDPRLEPERRRTVSRRRFRTLAERIKRSGAPFGAHTIVYRPSGELLLVRHEGVDAWVVPGGEVGADETLRAAAERELREEAGVDADYEGLGIAGRVEVAHAEYETWGVLPVFEARCEAEPVAGDDPDGEISAARWFAELPPDTRDRADLERWRERRGLA